jgi:hypothetical protein
VVLERLTAAGWPVTPSLRDGKAKVIRDTLGREFEKRKADMPSELAERVAVSWTELGELIRRARTDAGLPEGIDTVTPEGVQAGLLVFPELARLAGDLEGWVDSFYR